MKPTIPNINQQIIAKMDLFGVAHVYDAASCTGVGARHNFQRCRQRHLLRLRAGLALFGESIPPIATTDDSNKDATTDVATTSDFLNLPTYIPSVRATASDSDIDGGWFVSASIASAVNLASSARGCATVTNNGNGVLCVGRDFNSSRNGPFSEWVRNGNQQ